MEGLYVICVIISLAISILVLIKFLQIAKNIKELRNFLMEDKSLFDFNRLIETAKEDIYIGNHVDCKKYLLKAKYRIERESEDLKGHDYMNDVVEKNKNKISVIDELLSKI